MTTTNIDAASCLYHETPEGLILVVRDETTGKFRLPGGLLGPYENYWHGLVRKVHLDLGIALEVEHVRFLLKHTTDVMIMVYKYQGPAFDNIDLTKLGYVFFVTKETLLNPQHSNYCEENSKLFSLLH
jgi:hypothetical protein